MTDRARHAGPLPPFEDVVAEHGSTVMRVCRAIVGPPDADDAWVDTFVAALRAYPRLRPDSNVRGWLVTIAHNCSVDIVRGARRRPTPVGELPERGSTAVPEAAATAGEEQLRAALDELAPKQRAAVVYRHLADLSYPQVARLMGTSPAAARRNVADGIARLRVRLEGAQP